MKPTIGVLGGIGSGKSRVAAELARRGGTLISADELGHEALRQPAIREQLTRRWGSQVLNEQGEVDRRVLAGIVFQDPEELRALQAVVFPWIDRRIHEQLRAAAADPGCRFVVLDAAIMLETGWDRVCHWLVFVEAPLELRRERLARQRGWKTEDLERRERVQLPLEEKRRRADFVITNAGTPAELEQQVQDLLKEIAIHFDKDLHAR